MRRVTGRARERAIAVAAILAAVGVLAAGVVLEQLGETLFNATLV